MLWGLIWFVILLLAPIIYILYLIYTLITKLKQLKRFLTPSGDNPSRGEEK